MNNLFKLEEIERTLEQIEDFFRMIRDCGILKEFEFLMDYRCEIAWGSQIIFEKARGQYYDAPHMLIVDITIDGRYYNFSRTTDLIEIDRLKMDIFGGLYKLLDERTLNEKMMFLSEYQNFR